MTDEVEAREIARRLIEKQEGYSQFPYPDTGGTLAIGYGLNLNRRGIRKPEADWLVIQEVGRLYGWFTRFDFFQKLTPNRKAALIDMAYNLGEAGLDQFSRMLAWLDAGDYASAADEMMKSEWAKELPLRAAEDAEMMRRG